MSDIRKMVPRATGGIVVSVAGSMPLRYVLHAITIGLWGEAKELPLGSMVRQAAHQVMRLLPELGCTSVAFPAIGAGVAGIFLAAFCTDLNLNNSFDLGDRFAGPL